MSRNLHFKGETLKYTSDNFASSITKINNNAITSSTYATTYNKVATLGFDKDDKLVEVNYETATEDTIKASADTSKLVVEGATSGTSDDITIEQLDANTLIVVKKGDRDYVETTIGEINANPADTKTVAYVKSVGTATEVKANVIIVEYATTTVVTDTSVINVTTNDATSRKDKAIASDVTALTFNVPTGKLLKSLVCYQNGASVGTIVGNKITGLTLADKDTLVFEASYSDGDSETYTGYTVEARKLTSIDASAKAVTTDGDGSWTSEKKVTIASLSNAKDQFGKAVTTETCTVTAAKAGTGDITADTTSSVTFNGTSFVLTNAVTQTNDVIYTIKAGGITFTIAVDVDGTGDGTADGITVSGL